MKNYKVSEARKYRYVGAAEIIYELDLSQTGYVIHHQQDLQTWTVQAEQTWQNGCIIATFVINLQGELLLADRHSEHVMCAGGKEVLSAGEITLCKSQKEIFISEITNQSTGYCPEPSSWQSVLVALEKIAIGHPTGFTEAYEFRYCVDCHNIQLIKDELFECVACGAGLDIRWNLDQKNESTITR